MPPYHRFALEHTVALMLDGFVHAEHFGSGLVVEIGGRFFVLTAAHLFADDDWKGRLMFCVTKVDEHGVSGETAMVRLPADPELLAHPPCDAAALEVVPINDSSHRLLTQTSIPEQLTITGLAVHDASAWPTDSFMLCGYPGALASPVMDLAAVHGAITVEMGLPESDIYIHPDDFGTDEQLTFQCLDPTDTRGEALQSPFPLGGASGGTCWAIDRQNNTIALIGTHSSSALLGDGWIMRAAPIGIHLSMIAHSYPQLRDEIAARWPGSTQYRF